MEKIELNPRLEQVSVAVVGKTFSWESVPQSSVSLEEAARVEFTSEKWNTKRVSMDSYNGRGMASHNRHG